MAVLLDYLSEDGVLDNTIVIYTSDQGFMLGEHDYIDKRWMYEESLRLPLLVRYPPTVSAGSRNDALVNNTDFAPTMLDMAGVEIPSFMQGVSLLPLLKGEQPENWREATYYRYWMNMAHHDVPAHYGIRTMDYKLIFFYGLPLDAPGAKVAETRPGWELYDLQKDPHEQQNVYLDAAYADVVTKLKQDLLRTREEIGETDNEYPGLLKLQKKYW